MIRHRIARLRKELRKRKISAVVLSSPVHIRYFTNFSGSHAVCLVTPRSIVLITDPRYRTQSKEEVLAARILITDQNLFSAISKTGLVKQKSTVGFESQSLTYAELKGLKDHLRTIRLVPTFNLVEDLVQTKDTSEISAIQQAAHISDKVFDHILSMIRPGVRERDIAAEISYYHKRFGADADGFEPIVASGVRGALPHARASGKRVRKGELVTLDFGCRVTGYHSDMTRTISIGTPGRREKRMYTAVFEAQQEAVAAVREGISSRTLDAIARKRIASYGLRKYFIHSLGHGLGLRLHEKPTLSCRSTEILQSGHVITIEPGVYIPRLGGVRIEDDVVVTATGCKVLNRATKELVIL